MGIKLVSGIGNPVRTPPPAPMVAPVCLDAKGPIGHPDKASERDEVDIQGWQCGTRVSGSRLTEPS